MSSSQTRNVTPRVIPILPVAGDKTFAANEAASASLYEAHQKVYPRTVQGRFAILRWVMVWLTQVVFYGLPWLTLHGRQAVVFNLDARKFYIFDLVLWPQDFIYLTGLLVICALSLFLFTAVAGRVWCGYACPQTVYTEIFLWIERHIEGDRAKRMKLDAAPWSARKLGIKSIKQIAWIAFALWTGFTFVGYFTPIRNLSVEVAALSLGGWEIFWVLFYGFATYGNAGFMREQVCKHMCPYARFQGAMFDKDTLIITYDEQRGEPRGGRSRSGPRPAEAALGDCISCSLCVQVCPTGIDIREGLQIACISCAACIDVCDGVMDKMGYARGLIRYSSERAIQHGSDGKENVWRHLVRTRTFIYGLVLTLLSTGLLASLLLLRKPFKVDVIRDRGALGRMVEGGMVENTYRLQIMNATEHGERYRIEVSGLPGLSVASSSVVEVPATESRSVAVRLQVPLENVAIGSRPITFKVGAVGDGSQIREHSVFLIPH